MKSKYKGQYVRDLDSALMDRESFLYPANNRIVELFNKMDRGSMSLTQAQELGTLSKKLDEINNQYETAYPGIRSQAIASVNSIKKKNLIRKAIQWVLLIIAIILLLSGKWLISLILFIGMLIFRGIYTKKLSMEARNNAESACVLARNLRDQMGRGTTLERPAYGLYADVDKLYLSTLSPEDRRFVLQMRQQELHQQQNLQMQQQQLGIMQQQADAQRRANALAQEQVWAAYDQANALNKQNEILQTRPSERYR